MKKGYKLITMILSFIICSQLSAQSIDSSYEKRIVTSIENMNIAKDYRKVIDSCNKYLSIKFIKPSNLSELYFLKATAYSYILDSLYSNFHYPNDSIEYFGPYNYYDLVIEKHLDEIDSLFNLAIKTYDNYKLTYLFKKYKIDYVYAKVKKTDAEILKSHGFKQAIESWWFLPEYVIGKDNWIGFEANLGTHQGRYELIDTINGVRKIISTEQEFHFSVLKIGARKNISNLGWGASFGVFSFSAFWINISPANFAYLNTKDDFTVGYYPELGVHIGYFYINAGYNVAFVNTMKDYEKFLLSFKIEIPYARTR